MENTSFFELRSWSFALQTARRASGTFSCSSEETNERQGEYSRSYSKKLLLRLVLVLVIKFEVNEFGFNYTDYF